jgi:hypothetical protein
MDSSYNNFVARMGSFDDMLDLQPDEAELKHSDTLAHIGVKGMKWGRRKVRSYAPGQNMIKKMSKKEELARVSDKKKGPNLEAVGKHLNSATQNINTTSNALRTASSKKVTDLSELSDADLKKRVERLNLESRYNALAPAQVSKGRERLQNTLDIAGTTLAVASTAVSLALAIKQMKGN